MLLQILASMALLRELRDLGFEPFLAVVLFVVVVLWGSLLTLLAFFWRYLRNERRERDRLRDELQEDVERRLNDCESDREDLRADVTELKEFRTRLSSCPRKGCPMRLPP